MTGTGFPLNPSIKVKTSCPPSNKGKGNELSTAKLIEINAAKDPMERLEIHRKIQGLPRNSAPNRVRNRCWATGKPRGVYRNFGLCRNQLRQRAHNGELPGVVKSSW